MHRKPPLQDPGFGQHNPSHSHALFVMLYFARIEAFGAPELNKALLEERNKPHKSCAGLAALVTGSETTLME